MELPSTSVKKLCALKIKRNIAIANPENKMRSKYFGEGLKPVYFIVRMSPVKATRNSVNVEIIAEAV